MFVLVKATKMLKLPRTGLSATQYVERGSRFTLPPDGVNRTLPAACVAGPSSV